MSGNNPAWLAPVRFDDKGLVTAVAIDDRDGAVLMLAHMNAEALEKTLATGRMTYWSRSRNSLWVKGETSGNTQKVVSVHLDCDGDALVFRVIAEGLGAACHEGYRSCFFRKFEDGEWAKQGSPIAPPTPH
jgi:phosphoribosyl-AMP cyclohydrolase